MSVELKIRRHIAQTRPDPQLGETVINIQKKIEVPLFTLVKDLNNNNKKIFALFTYIYMFT